MKWPQLEQILKKQGLVLFSAQEFRRAGRLTPSSAKFLLIRYIQKGLITKLKERRGLYCLAQHPPHPWLLANKLLRPSYVSLESALAHYGMIPESVYAVTSITTRPTRSLSSLGRSFLYHKVKECAYQGYTAFQVDQTSVFIAEPEKAIADYLYFVYLKKKMWNDRFRWGMAKKPLVLEYLKVFQRQDFVRWAKHVITKHS